MTSQLCPRAQAEVNAGAQHGQHRQQGQQRVTALPAAQGSVVGHPEGGQSAEGEEVHSHDIDEPGGGEAQVRGWSQGTGHGQSVGEQRAGGIRARQRSGASTRQPLPRVTSRERQLLPNWPLPAGPTCSPLAASSTSPTGRPLPAQPGPGTTPRRPGTGRPQKATPSPSASGCQGPRAPRRGRAPQAARAAAARAP